MRSSATLELAPVIRRLDWAAEHTRRLGEIIAAYVSSEPFEVSQGLDETGRFYRHRAELSRPCPPDVSMILGDAIHNYRSSLDHLVGALREGGPSTRSAFPVAQTTGDWDLALKRSRLEGVPQWAVDAIARVQPFDAEYGKLSGSLQLLEELSNRDKHRALVVSASIVRAKYVAHDSEREDSGIRFLQPSADVAEVEVPTGVEATAKFEAEVRIVEPDLTARELPGCVQGFDFDIRWRILGDIVEAARLAGVQVEGLPDRAIFWG